MTDNTRSDGNFNYLCSGCGEFVDSDEDLLHSGCVLTCPECGGETVVDFYRVDQYVKMNELREHVDTLLAGLGLRVNMTNKRLASLERLVEAARAYVTFMELAKAREWEACSRDQAGGDGDLVEAHGCP